MPVENFGPPPSAKLPNDPNDIPMGLDSDAKTVVISAAFSQAVSTTKRPVSAIICPNNLHQPGTRNVVPRGSHSPRRRFNRKPCSGFSHDFVDNRQ